MFNSSSQLLSKVTRNVLTLLLVLFTLAISSQKAQAQIYPSDTSSCQAIAQAKRSSLLKYDRLLKDADDLKFQMSQLERVAPQHSSKALDMLHGDLKHTYYELRQVELDIRDLNNILSRAGF